MNDCLSALRTCLEKQHLDGFILPVNDEFMGEYIPACAKRLEWLTGFTGSAGLAVALNNNAAFFTDGRYTLQASQQVQGYELYNSSDVSPESWIAKHAAKGTVIGYDPKLHTLKNIQRYEQKAKGIIFRPVEQNPIDVLWEDRPQAPSGAIQIHPLKYTGVDSATKRKSMSAELEKLGADVAILTAPDSICWLLNIRGNDVPCTPFVLCYALLTRDFSKVALFVDAVRVSDDLKAHLGESVEIHPFTEIAKQLARFRGGNVLYDAAASPVWFHRLLTNMDATIIEGTDPCQLAKACKNEVELEGMRNAHLRDGLAVTRFLCWLDNAMFYKEKLTERSVAMKLEDFRRENGMFREPSFATIAGSGPHGAIVHYHATEASDRALAGDIILLLDSGGQYPDGTTDITRTIAIGTPTSEMKDRFTRVLKGHIALATAIFPEGTTGSQLDALARQFLWAEGLDYDHGTGHGVGSYLSVHEGPQRISKRAGDAALKVGMILSNEPGYYKNGEYGIRIESLVMVKEHSKKEEKQFFAFETLTLAPIDMRLVEDALLSDTEKQWITNYHRTVYKAFANELSPAELHWLARYGT